MKKVTVYLRSSDGTVADVVVGDVSHVEVGNGVIAMMDKDCHITAGFKDFIWFNVEDMPATEVPHE